ncbi:hypothetical protein C0Q70_17411 [Pomacea canaliculata]|uniref:Uncharacterized protein n=1 Tax=Pomacea canaliculata TaxID=400727 RepID=A0A2T7NKB7_POMCA|nr:hypothetical protein C0Q70_17411 [Pomacea canaliculata]
MCRIVAVSYEIWSVKREQVNFVQKSEEAKARNVVTLYNMRNENCELHKEIAFNRTGGEHIVIKLFSGRPTQKGLMMHKNVTEAVATMDHKTFELSRYLGYLNYQAQKLKKTLKSKQQALEDLEKEVKGNEEDYKNSELLRLQNEAELMKMKRDDAWNTSQCYKKMVDHLKKDIQTMLQEIETMKKTKADKKVVLEELRRIRALATKEYEHIQNQLVPLRIDVENKTKFFDTTLRGKRRAHTDQLRETHTRIATEQKGPSYEEDNPEKALAKELSIHTELKAYQDVFEMVKDALEISDVKDVLRRVHDEHQRYSQLCQQLDETNNNYSMLKKELDDLKYEFLRMKYDLKPLGPTPQALATLQKEADKQHARLRELCDKLLFKERVIAGIKLALVAIHSKLLYVKLKPGQLVTLVGEPKKDMEVISSKITRLLDEYGSETINEAEVDMKEVQNYAELRLPEDNLRTTLRSLDYVSHENLRVDLDEAQAGYVSREDIKIRAMEILKPKKKPPQAPPKKKKH